MLRIDADIPGMAECGRDVLVQVLDQYQSSIVVTGLETNSGKELPRELRDLLEQVSQDCDAVLDFAGSRILVIGTNQGASDCQQRIAAFMQQVSGHLPSCHMVRLRLSRSFFKYLLLLLEIYVICNSNGHRNQSVT